MAPPTLRRAAAAARGRTMIIYLLVYCNNNNRSPIGEFPSVHSKLNCFGCSKTTMATYDSTETALHASSRRLIHSTG